MDWAILLPSLLFLLFLFFLSDFFSGSESALTAASRARMHALAEDGDKRAVTVNQVLSNKDRLIGAILLGNNAVNTLAAAISTSLMIGLFGEAGIYYATAIVTIMLLVFSEVLPKTYALYHADRVSLFVAPVIRVLVIAATPVTIAVSGVVRAILRLFGERIDNSFGAADIAELRGAIELHQGPEAETRERRDMLRSILDLADRTVEEVMMHRKNVFAVSIDQNTADAIEQMLEGTHTRIPLWSGSPENIVGIMHVMSLMFALHDAQSDRREIDLRSLMLQPWFIPNTTSLLDQLRAFRARREHIAMVVDEYGTYMGIVTLEDILEEIVGNIEDEQDLVVPGVRLLPDGTYLINGDFPIRDLNRELHWDLPDDDYTTLAGLVIYESRTIPDAGQHYSFYGYEFDVVKRQRHQLTVLRVKPKQIRLAA